MLEGCVAKVERAKELIDNLDNEISSILSSGKYQVFSGHEFDKKRYVFRLQGPNFPLRLSVLTGEIIHHLRSTFDHLVWAAASKEGLSSTKLKRITFPVCATPEKFQEAIKNGLLSGTSQELRNFVESLQPYQSGDDARNSIVQILHDLDVIEKHRLLVLVTHAVRMGRTLTFTGELTSDVEIIVASSHTDSTPFFRAIENDEEVHWVEYQTTTKPLWNIVNDFSIQVAFPEIGTSERVEVIPILRQMYALVEEIFMKVKLEK